MNLPENKCKHNQITIDTLPETYECMPGCPACAVAARDKEWAEWILEHFDFITSVAENPDDFVLVDCYPITLADFVALKKLKEG